MLILVGGHNTKISYPVLNEQFLLSFFTSLKIRNLEVIELPFLLINISINTKYNKIKTSQFG